MGHARQVYPERHGTTWRETFSFGNVLTGLWGDPRGLWATGEAGNILRYE